MKEREITLEERTAIQSITGVSVIDLESAKKARETILSALKSSGVNDQELLDASLQTLGCFDQVRLLLFLLSLIRQVTAHQKAQIEAKYIFDSTRAFKKVAAGIAAGDIRLTGKKRAARGKRQAKYIDPLYDRSKASHNGLLLREALDLSKMGFHKLCVRCDVQGVLVPGKSTIYSRADAKKLWAARFAAMSPANQKLVNDSAEKVKRSRERPQCLEELIRDELPH